ncbi:MAG TPA: glycosyltransferase family A protein [Arenibaculum sp.]|nr:glycosyltransferase family A protein [Arenibaculum sp.]
MPAISVVIPVFNRPEQLSDALSSVLAQSFRDYEVIVVDDGSTNDCSRAIKPYLGSNVRAIYLPENRGAAAARNVGVAQARGEYIAFLDSDDAWYPHKLGEQMTLLRGLPPSMPACVSGYLLKCEHERTEHEVRFRQGKDLRPRLIWGCDLSPGSTLVVARRCFDEIGPFDETLRRLEDWDWLLRFRRRYGITATSSVLAVIKQGRDANHHQVIAALKTVEGKRDSYFAPHCRIQRAKFASTILVEKAAAEYRRGHNTAAARLIGQSLVAWPFRNLKFYGTLVGRTLSASYRRFAAPARTTGPIGDPVHRANDRR